MVQSKEAFESALAYYADRVPSDFRHLLEEADYNRVAAEEEFLLGERWRQFKGYSALYGLLALEDQRINEILGIDAIPEEFDFSKHWLKPTRRHIFHGEIEIPLESPCKRLRDLQLEVRGVRIKINIADRDGEGRKRGLITPVGGGVRADFVSAKKAGKVYKIENWEARREEMLEDGGALAAAMVPKNLSLNFQNHLIEVLQTMDLGEGVDRQNLIAHAQKVILGGGAKADIVIAVPSDILENLTPEEKAEIVGKALYAAGYHWGKAEVIGPDRDRLAGDKNTGFRHPDDKAVLNDLAEGYLAAMLEKAKKTGEQIDERLAMATVTGKTGKYGLEAREAATGFGAWISYLAYEQHLARKRGSPIGEDGIPAGIKDKKTFFRGCGNAAYSAIIEAAKAGLKVHAIADLGTLITCEEGFSETDALELYDVFLGKREGIKTTADWVRQAQKDDPGRGIKIEFESKAASRAEKEKETAEAVNKYWRTEQPEVIFEAATQMTINKDNAWNVPVGAIIVEIGNGVTTPLAAEILKSRRIDHIPGINCNAGGVFTSWFEWAQGVFGVRFGKEDIERAIISLMQTNMEETFALKEHLEEKLEEKYGIKFTQEEIFYALAMAKGLKARERVAEEVKRLSS